MNRTHHPRRAAAPHWLFALAAATLLSACGDSNNGAEPTYQAEIRRTAMGVPHIKAESWQSLGYGYGYVQAEDNLCTMADSFLTYRGERSQFFGPDALLVASSTIGRPKNIDSDFFHRHLISDDVVQKLIAAQPDNLKQLVTGFAAGYNRYVRDIKAKPGANAACAAEAWVRPVTAEDIYRRMYQTNLAGGYSNFLANIASAEAPTVVAPSGTNAHLASLQLKAGELKLPEMQVGGREGVGSNMFGFGTAATGEASPLLFGNPHWYWRGPDRFYQAQLTIPGQLNVSGSSFLGIPVILIGFNDNVAWSHTVSTARRFGFFELTLAAGDRTSYMRDGAAVKMQPTTISVQAKQADGSIATVTRTLYKSEYGPLVNLAPLNPALAWNQAKAYAIRDINADNFRLYRNWMRWSQARSLDEFITIQREEAAIPWVNTAAVGRGAAKAWYADIGAVPNVSPAQVAICTTPAGMQVNALMPRVPFFDGSRSACDWQSDPDSVQKGALPASRMPSLLRDDYVANMNDSYWLANPASPLTGYPDIMGPAGTEAVTYRTRLGNLLAQGRLDGSDGYGGNKATSDIVQRMVLNSRVLTAELFKTQALALVCNTPSIDVAKDPQTGEVIGRSVTTGPACAVLQAWNNTGTLASHGAHVWDEFWARAARLPAASLYGVPFSASDPLHTPRDLKATAAADLKQAFGAAIARVEASGYAFDASRGEVLFATRSGQKIGLFGGCGSVGYFTISCSENRLDQGGYTMDKNPNGNSYMQVVRFPEGGVDARTFLTFSLSDDPASAHNADYTRAYAAGQWLKLPFAESEIAADPELTITAIRE